MTVTHKLRELGSALKARSQVRKQLRGPADLQYAMADAIGMLDADAWHALTAKSGFFMSRAYLAALEAVLPTNLSPRYAMIFSGSGASREPVAAMYMQVADVTLAQARPEKSAAERGTIDQFASKASQRILTCGNLLTFGQHGIAFAEGVDQKLAWHGVAEVLYRIRESQKLEGKTHFVMIKDLHSPFAEHAAHLENLSYRYVETEPNMVLDLLPEWKSYDDYVASLASKYRTKVKNTIFKVIDEAGCSVESLSGLAAAETQIHALYKAVQVNAAFRPFELVPQYFAALEAMAGDRFRCTVVRQGDTLLGFLISVADGDTSIAYHIGFDRKAAADLPIYLRLLHAGIADAISLGCKQISYGRTALEPKASLGARPQPFGMLVRHRQPVLNKLIKRVLLGVEHEEAPERSPFKKAKQPA